MPDSPLSAPLRPGQPVWPGVAVALVLVLAIAIRLLVPIDANIDWLMSNDRAFLAGKTLYRDIVETNPPMAIFIYLPGAWIERLTGWPAEGAFTALLLSVGALSAWVFTHWTGRAGMAGPWRLPLVLAVLLVAPLSAWGEREHVALILLMPLFALAALRLAGQSVAWPTALATGVVAAIAPMIKPHFALPILVVYVVLAIRRRDARLLLSPEAVAAAVACLLYAALVSRVLPAYAYAVMPLLFDLYWPMREPLTSSDLVLKALLWGAALACLAFSARRAALAPVPLVLLAAATGFFAAFLLQGRGWPYHALPYVLLTMLAVALCIPQSLHASPSRRRIAVASLIAALAPLGFLTAFGYHGRGVVAPIRAAIAHPTLMSISFDLAPGHPIATEVGGTWVGTYSSRWITANADTLLRAEHDPARDARLKAWLRYDRAVTNRDLTKRPDIVLVGLGPFDWPGWIAADPQTRALMGDYVRLAEDPLTPEQRRHFEGVAAYIRKDRLRPAP